MTKHRSREAWITDILRAAAALVDEEGYANLTMDAVAARTGLSKGGVYRFFPSKRELALALLRRVYYHSTDFEIDEVVGWDLSMEETLLRVMVEKPTEDYSSAQRDDRVWLQLMPQTLWDPAFAEEWERLYRDYEQKCIELIMRVFKRDGVVLDTDKLEAVETAVHTGLILRDGLAVRASLGMSIHDTSEVGRRFIRDTVRHLLSDLANLARS